ncbi:DUF362 domain-containing protein [Bryobacter aggregatus]|uniref:DUF362 domain-containing protein n=1 Tax=Bryobacter aggregatus TaxID=360054 RepID=UPI0004E1BFA5|nr:DUF362 domain-containing protein [Bryobacter aggregatus]
MELSRRQVLSMSAGAFAPIALQGARIPKSQFTVHPFVEAHPKAVFIKKTNVATKTDEEAKRAEGLSFARDVLMPVDLKGIPVSHRVILKPNFTSVRNQRPDVENLGTGTDAQFYEGIVMGLKELGVKKMSFLEANGFHTWNYRGLIDINERHGIDMNEPDRRERNFRDGYEMTWTKVHDPVVYSRIPHYAPVNEPNTWLLNIAKWKSHGMCMTLSTKNLQGLVVKPFVRFCPGWSMVTGVPAFMKPDIHADVEARVNRYFDNHKKLGYARYDSPADLSPVHQEIWAHKTCDNYQTLTPGLNIIEGIYGRSGDGFGVGTDYMTNLVMFGKDRLNLDLIGMYLGGHEPGNVNLFRIAKERGLMSTFNPWEIEIFEWVNGNPVPRKLSQLTRTPLDTYYLQKVGEPKYHLVNDRFDYDKVRV